MRILLIFFLLFVPSYGNYDFAEVVMHWPPAYKITKAGQGVTYKMPYPMDFKIHGLWPADSSTGISVRSCSGKILDLPKIKKAFQPRLGILWPNLIAGSNNETFWIHEWKDHGTCSEAFISQYQYFNISLFFKADIDIYRILDQEGISPGPKLYDPRDIHSAIKKHTKFDPTVRCDPTKTPPVLTEISVCVDKLGHHLIDCYPNLPHCRVPNVFFNQ